MHALLLAGISLQGSSEDQQGTMRPMFSSLLLSSRFLIIKNDAFMGASSAWLQAIRTIYECRYLPPEPLVGIKVLGLGALATGWNEFTKQEF